MIPEIPDFKQEAQKIVAAFPEKHRDYHEGVLRGIFEQGMLFAAGIANDFADKIGGQRLELSPSECHEQQGGYDTAKAIKDFKLPKI